MAEQVRGAPRAGRRTSYVDIWQCVRPKALGIDGWPDVPRGEDWKTGVCRRLGWVTRPRAGAGSSRRSTPSPTWNPVWSARSRPRSTCSRRSTNRTEPAMTATDTGGPLTSVADLLEERLRQLGVMRVYGLPLARLSRCRSTTSTWRCCWPTPTAAWATTTAAVGWGRHSWTARSFTVVPTGGRARCRPWSTPSSCSTCSPTRPHGPARGARAASGPGSGSPRPAGPVDAPRAGPGAGRHAGSGHGPSCRWSRWSVPVSCVPRGSTTVRAGPQGRYRGGQHLGRQGRRTLGQSVPLRHRRAPGEGLRAGGPRGRRRGDHLWDRPRRGARGPVGAAGGPGRGRGAAARAGCTAGRLPLDTQPSAAVRDPGRVVTPRYESDAVPLTAPRASLHLSGALPERGVAVADPGRAGFWVARTFPTSIPGSVCVPATGGAASLLRRRSSVGSRPGPVWPSPTRSVASTVWTTPRRRCSNWPRRSGCPWRSSSGGPTVDSRTRPRMSGCWNST